MTPDSELIALVATGDADAYDLYLRRGNRPGNFRAYLLATIRNAAYKLVPDARSRR